MLVVPAMQNDRTSLGPRREFCNHLLAPLPSCPTAQPCFNAMLLAHDVKLSPRKEIPLPTLGYEAGFHTQQYILVFPLPEGCLIGCNPVRHTKTSSSLGVWKQKVPEGLFVLENLIMKFRRGGVTQFPFPLSLSSLSFTPSTLIPLSTESPAQAT